MSALVAGRALDAEVAEKVMGWKQSVVSNFPWQLEPPDEECVVRSVPHYSSDIASAFLVVEKLRPSLFFELRTSGSISTPPGPSIDTRFIARFVSSLHPCGFQTADTAPLAICLAALASLSSGTQPDEVKA